MKYKYDKDQLLEKLKRAASGYRHPQFKHNKEEAEFWKKIITGDSQDDLIISYKLSESENQKNERVRLYNARTSYVAGRIYQSCKEVKRTDNITNDLIFKGDDDKAKAQLEDSTNNFEGNQSVEDYIHETFQRYNFFDPNAFLAIEFDRTDGAIDPYPVVVESKNAADFEFYHGNLQYLISCYECDLNEMSKSTPAARQVTKKEKGKKYTLYGHELAWELRELGKKGKAIEPKNESGQLIEIAQKDGGRKTMWFLKEYNMRPKGVPAHQLGYIKDPLNDFKTYTSFLHPARNLFREMINTKSEYDLHKALHGFIQKFAYAEDCNYEHIMEGGTKDKCDRGSMLVSGDVCPKCKGSGVKVHTSVQDVILLKMPDSREERIPLEDMVHYVEIPAHMITGLKEDLEELEAKCNIAIFNSSVFDRAEIAVTATEKKLDKESANIVFADYGEANAIVQKFAVNQIAKFQDLDGKFTHTYSFPKDFKMESYSELLTLRKNMSEAGSPYFLLDSVDSRLLNKQYRDDQSFILKVQARERFRPFRDKSQEEVMIIVSMLPELHPRKVLWMYFDEIFEDIYNDDRYKKFHIFKWPVQKEVVEKKVNEVIERERSLYGIASLRDPNPDAD